MQRGIRTILFVDEDESIRAGAAKALGSLGCKIATAGDADTALALVRSDASIAALFVSIMLAEAKTLVIGAKGHRPICASSTRRTIPRCCCSTARRPATVRSCACLSTSNRPEPP
jgi:CheY-like chemotaxis protein